MRLICALIDNSGYSAFTTYIAKYTSINGGSSPKQLFKPVIVSDGEEVAVWGYMMGNNSGRQLEDETITAIAKRVEWAIVLKIRIGKEQWIP